MKSMSKFIKWSNDNQGIIALVSIIAAIVLTSSGALLAGVVLIILLFLFFLISHNANLLSPYNDSSQLRTTNTSQNKDTTTKVLNHVSILIANLPNNNDLKGLYDTIDNHAKKWSSDAKFVGSRVYLNFSRNKCSYHIIGIIDSNIRHERKKLWVPDINEIIEEQDFGEIEASPILTKYRFWKLAVTKVLEASASDVEKLEECHIQILPLRESLSISIFFEKLPRKWSKHFGLKKNILYEGQTTVFKFK